MITFCYGPVQRFDAAVAVNALFKRRVLESARVYGA